MHYRSLKKLGLSLALIGVGSAVALAQTKTPKPPASSPGTLMVEPSGLQSAQVVTVVHRVNGIKALVLLQRSGEKVSAVDDDLMTTTDAVTSITAGFALGDGQSIVALLSRAEAEAQTLPLAWSPLMPASSKILDNRTPPAKRAEFVVVGSNGKQLAARYVGLDGGSGLSLLKIPGLEVPSSRDADEVRLAPGQRVRLFAPIRLASRSNIEPGTVAVSVGEIEGKITEINRTSTGRIARLTIMAPNLSPAITGGVALNDAGEAIGIVETINAGEARLIPAAAVRRAAERVLARQASVPRPWLGVRGEAVAATPLERFYLRGWTESEAAALKGKQEGILLTSVAPGTPAALADMRPGDVIVRVNDFEIKNTEDFSYVLNEVGSGATVNFTFFRGQLPKPVAPFALTPIMPLPQTPSMGAMMSPDAFKFKPLVVSVRLSESLNPAQTMRLAESYAFGYRGSENLPPIAHGVETVALSMRAAAHLNARAGFLVVFVDPESAAARAGLHEFDVIETVNGKLVGQTSWTAALPSGNPEQLSLGVVRDRQRVEITVKQKNE